MKKLIVVFLSSCFIIGFCFNAFAFNERNSSGRHNPGRDSSLSVRKITDVRKRFEPKSKYNYLDYIQNQNASAQAGSFWIDGNGTIGGNMLVGTSTDAGYKLDVNGTGRFANDLLISRSNNGDDRLLFSLPDWSIVRPQYSTELHFNSGGSHHWYVSGTEAMRITSNRNLLIGNTFDAGYKLDVNGTGRFTGDINLAPGTYPVRLKMNGFSVFEATDVNYLTINEGLWGGVRIKHSAAASSMASVGGGVQIYNTDATSDNIAFLRFYSANGTKGAGIGSTNNELVFATTTNSAEKARLTSGGNLLIGTTTEAGYKLDVNGTGRFNGNVFVNSTSGFKTSLHALGYGSTSGEGFLFASVNGSFDNPGAYIKGTPTGIWGSMVDFYARDGAGAMMKNILRLNGEGNGSVLMGTTVDAGIYKLQLSGGLLLNGQTVEPSGVNGGIVYNSSTNQFRGYRNGQWKNFLMEGDASTGTSSGWQLGGNASTDPLTNFIGTTDNQSLNFRTNNVNAATILADGKVGIGTLSPSYTLDVNGSPTGAFRVKPSAIASSSAFFVAEIQGGYQPFMVYGNGVVSMYNAPYVSVANIFNTGAERGKIHLNSSATGDANGLVQITGSAGNLGSVLTVKNMGTTIPKIFDVHDNVDGSQFYVTNSFASAQKMLIGTTTEAGYKLDVNGTGKFGTANLISGYVFNPTQAGIFDGEILSTALRIGYGAPQNIAMAVNGEYNIGAFNFTSQLSGYTKLQQVGNETTDPDRIMVWSNDNRISYMTKSQLGIGASGSSNGWTLSGNASTTVNDFIGTTSGNTQPLIFKTNGEEAFRINNLGQISIGTTDTKGYKLAVNGDAIFTKVKVKQYPWSDYVFNSAYKLPSLKEVEEYIKKYKHLPDVPSEKEVQKNGLDVGDNQAVLLKKIEELTLYIIEQDKKIESQQKEITDLKTINSTVQNLTKQIEELSKQIYAAKNQTN